MKSLHGVLHGRVWIRVHGLPESASGLPARGGCDEILGDHDFFDIFPNMIDFRIDYKAYSKIDSRIDSEIDKHHQLILLN